MNSAHGTLGHVENNTRPTRGDIFLNCRDGFGIALGLADGSRISHRACSLTLSVVRLCCNLGSHPAANSPRVKWWIISNSRDVTVRFKENFPQHCYQITSSGLPSTEFLFLSLYYP